MSKNSERVVISRRFNVPGLDTELSYLAKHISLNRSDCVSRVESLRDEIKKLQEKVNNLEERIEELEQGSQP